MRGIGDTPGEILRKIFILAGVRDMGVKAGVAHFRNEDAPLQDQDFTFSINKRFPIPAHMVEKKIKKAGISPETFMRLREQIK